MLRIKDTGKFKKDYKQCIKRGLDINLLKSVIGVLAIPEKLPKSNQEDSI